MAKPNRKHRLKCKQVTSPMMRQDVQKLIKHGLDQAKFTSTLETNFMKQCLLSRTPRSQFTTDGSNPVTRNFQIRVTPVNFS